MAAGNVNIFHCNILEKTKEKVDKYLECGSSVKACFYLELVHSSCESFSPVRLYHHHKDLYNCTFNKATQRGSGSNQYFI